MQTVTDLIIIKIHVRNGRIVPADMCSASARPSAINWKWNVPEVFSLPTVRLTITKGLDWSDPKTSVLRILYLVKELEGPKFSFVFFMFLLFWPSKTFSGLEQPLPVCCFFFLGTYDANYEDSWIFYLRPNSKRFLIGPLCALPDKVGLVR